MQPVQRQNSSDYFKSLVDGLHINIFALLASLNVHLSAKTVLSNRANPKCQPQARAAWSCRHLQKPSCADASLQDYLTGLWHMGISKRAMQYQACWETQPAVLECRNSCAFSNLEHTILIKIFGLESYPTLNCRLQMLEDDKSTFRVKIQSSSEKLYLSAKKRSSWPVLKFS